MIYKLTDAAWQTYGGIQWGPGVTHEADRSLPPTLCTAGVIHAYTHPLLAVLLDPIHGQYGEGARLWEAQGRVVARDNGLKVGCRSLTTRRQIEVPAVTTVDRIRFALLCALAATPNTPDTPDASAWREWADGWLAGANRSCWATNSAALAMWTERAAACVASWTAEEQALAGAPLDLVKMAKLAVEDPS